ncbi:MAG TPA: hypothetical protein DEQ02_06150 [Ruminococcaceae bacterium]|nr:hypothetical protein [Oscillospiraceae bacterium]
MEKIFVQNEKIALRPVILEDLPKRVEWLNSEPILRWMNAGRVTLQSTDIWFEKNKNDPSKLHCTVLCAKTGRALGIAGLTSIDMKNLNAELYLAIGEADYLKKGLAPHICGLLTGFGFESLGLNRVYAFCYADNHASLKTFLRAGYKREGVLRHHAMYDGTPKDRLVLGILKGELVLL